MLRALRIQDNKKPLFPISTIELFQMLFLKKGSQAQDKLQLKKKKRKSPLKF